MNDNKISITVDWDLDWNEKSLNHQIEQAIVKAATKQYLKGLEKTFEKKLETMLHEQAFKIVKNINSFELDKCNADGLKETISMEDYISKKAIESLGVARDVYGQTGHTARSEKHTMIEWVVKKTIEQKDNVFTKELKTQIDQIEAEYQAKLQGMVTKTLAPIYSKLVDKLNS